MTGRRGEGGQSAVELALVLPLIALLVLCVVQVGLVVRDQVLVIHAAREAARTGAVDPRPSASRAAAVRASGLDPARLELTMTGGADEVRAAIRYKSPTEVPIVGPLVPDVTLEARLSMRREPG